MNKHLYRTALGAASVIFRTQGDPLVDKIDAILPQTQCGQCGYPGCKPYAEAIANGDKINKCPPGGEATIQALADLLDVEVEPLDAAASLSGLRDVPGVVSVQQREALGLQLLAQRGLVARGFELEGQGHGVWWRRDDSPILQAQHGRRHAGRQITKPLSHEEIETSMAL